MSVTVTFPTELLVASREDEAQFTQRVMIYTLGHLYEQGKISSGIGAQILGCDKWTFYQRLSEYGFAVIDYPTDELATEAATSGEIAAHINHDSPPGSLS